MGDSPERAGQWLHDNLCPHVKRILDRALDDDLPDLTGLVVVSGCDAMRRLGRRLYANTRPLAWCGVCVPFDLLNAMGVTSCFAEFIGGMLSAAGVAAPFIEGAETAGFLADGCTWQRAVIGAAEMGIMPPPDLVIASSSPCSAGLATAEHLARRCDCPLFVLHVPDQGT